MAQGSGPRHRMAPLKPRLSPSERRRLFRAFSEVDLLFSIFLEDLVNGAYGPLGLSLERPKGQLRPAASIESHSGDDRSISSFTLIFRFPLKLTPKVASLLLILAGDWGASEDDRVGWKPFDEVLAAMRAMPGGESLSAHALCQLVYRLKEELATAGLPQELVQWSALRRAYRFACLRKKPESTGGQSAARLL